MIKKFFIFLVILIIITSFFVFWQLIRPPKENIKDKEDSYVLKIKERGKLIVGGEVPYGVMEFFDENGNIVGLDVDIAKEVATRMGVELEFKNYKWDLLFDAVKKGEIDFAASAITITPERKQEMLFSSPYFNGGQIIITRADNDNINSLNDLAKKKIGVQVETTGHYAIKKYVSDDLITAYDTYEGSDTGFGIIHDLKIGKINAVIVDYIAAVETVKEDPALKIIGEPFTQEFYGLPTNLGNTGFMNEVDKILRDIKSDGTLRKIEDKWVK